MITSKINKKIIREPVHCSIRNFSFPHGVCKPGFERTQKEAQNVSCMKERKRSESRFLDPAILASIQSLDLIARTVVEGLHAGLHKSPTQGFSANFDQYRPYIAGDDLRYIDWRVYARTDRYYVKQFEQETNLTAYFVVDTSRSMAYKPGALAKLDYARFLAATLAFMAIGQRDRIALFSLAEGIKTALPAGGGRRHLSAFFHQLEILSAEGRSDLRAALVGLAASLSRKGLVILISDLYDDPQQVANAIARLRRAGHEVIVFHLTDSSERTLDFQGAIEFEDLETGRLVALDANRARRDYTRRLDEAIAYYKREMTAEGIDFVSLDMSRPLDYALYAYLHRRSSRRPGS